MSDDDILDSISVDDLDLESSKENGKKKENNDIIKKEDVNNEENKKNDNTNDNNEYNDFNNEDITYENKNEISYNKSKKYLPELLQERLLDKEPKKENNNELFEIKDNSKNIFQVDNNYKLKVEDKEKDIWE